MKALESAVGGLVLLAFVVLIVLQRRRLHKHHEFTPDGFARPEPEPDRESTSGQPRDDRD